KGECIVVPVREEDCLRFARLKKIVRIIPRNEVARAVRVFVICPQHVPRYEHCSEEKHTACGVSLDVPAFQHTSQKLDCPENTHPDPNRKNKERSDIKIIALPRLRFLQVKINVENNSHNDEKGQKNKPHLPVFLVMVDASDDAEEEGNAVQLFP